MNLFRKIDKTKVYAPDGGADLYVDSGLREWESSGDAPERALNENARASRDKLFAKIMRNLEERKEDERDQEFIELSLKAIRASIKTSSEESTVDND